jgi:hypothetical protein
MVSSQFQNTTKCRLPSPPKRRSGEDETRRKQGPVSTNHSSPPWPSVLGNHLASYSVKKTNKKKHDENEDKPSCTLPAILYMLLLQEIIPSFVLRNKKQQNNCTNACYFTMHIITFFAFCIRSSKTIAKLLAISLSTLSCSYWFVVHDIANIERLEMFSHKVLVIVKSHPSILKTDT